MLNEKGLSWIVLVAVLGVAGSQHSSNLDVIGFVAKPSTFRSEFRGAQFDGGDPYKFMAEFPLLKTICLVDFYDHALVQLAKQRRMSVLSLERPTREAVNDHNNGLRWIEAAVQRSLEHGMDGVVLRYEEPIASADQKQKLNMFLARSKHNLQQANLSIGFEAPFSPVDNRNESTYGRNYDWKYISGIVDRLIVTVYDQNLLYRPEQGANDECFVLGDASLYNMLGGLLAYADLGVAMNKITIILPLYGLDYQCIVYKDNMRCLIDRDAHGFCTNRVAEKVILDEPLPKDGRVGLDFWDEHSSTHYYVYLERGHGLLHKFFHEIPYTLELKIKQSLQFNIAGFGYWPMNAYNHTFSANIQHSSKPLWRRRRL